MTQIRNAEDRDEYWLVLLETLANQEHLFASNKLREIVGASEQIYLSTTAWCDKTTTAIKAEGEADFKPVISASGKAVLLARSRELGRKLITRISCDVQKNAPGLTIIGAVSENPVQLNMPAGDFHKTLGDLHDRHRRLRGEAGLGEGRFLRSPFSAECASTGAAAAGFDGYDPELKDQPDAKAYSATALGKRKHLKDAAKRLNAIFGGRLDFSSEEGGESAGTPAWWSVVHADGNGLGQLFLRFDECLPSGSNAADYIAAFGKFSKALDECTREAAVAALPRGDKVQLKPIVLAGDDLTVICDGAIAVDFTEQFLRNFVEKTAKHPSITPVAKMAKQREILRSASLTAAAGVAIVKPHHPFHRAYELAEALCQSAKACKTAATAVSALDIHVAFDHASDLDDIRKHLTVNVTDMLWGGPYALSDGPCQLEGGRSLRSFAMLKTSMAALSEGEPLPLGRGQQHDLRTALFDGAASADAAIARLKHRPDISDKFKAQLFGGAKPFEGHSTLLLDAMDLASVKPAS